jgi:hypothetical protein
MDMWINANSRTRNLILEICDDMRKDMAKNKRLPRIRDMTKNKRYDILR